MSRGSLDVAKMARASVVATLARTKIGLDQSGAIFAEMVAERTALIRQVARACARVADDQARWWDTERIKACGETRMRFHERRVGAADAADAIRRAVCQRRGR